MAGTTGLEPATSAVTGQRSNQLSYVPSFLDELDRSHVESSFFAPFAITLSSTLVAASDSNFASFKTQNRFSATTEFILADVTKFLGALKPSFAPGHPYKLRYINPADFITPVI
jgi:hypothetical protein